MRARSCVGSDSPPTNASQTRPIARITRPSTLAYPTPLSLPRECPVVSAKGKNYLYHRNKGEGRSVPTTIIGYRSSNCFHFVVRSWPPGRVTRRSGPPPKVPQSVVCDIVLIQMKKQVQTEKWQGMPLEEAPHLSPVAQYPHAELRGGGTYIPETRDSPPATEGYA